LALTGSHVLPARHVVPPLLPAFGEDFLPQQTFPLQDDIDSLLHILSLA